jgi:hypothetical protein
LQLYSAHFAAGPAARGRSRFASLRATRRAERTPSPERPKLRAAAPIPPPSPARPCCKVSSQGQPAATAGTRAKVKGVPHLRGAVKHREKFSKGAKFFLYASHCLTAPLRRGVFLSSGYASARPERPTDIMGGGRMIPDYCQYREADKCPVCPIRKLCPSWLEPPEQLSLFAPAPASRPEAKLGRRPEVASANFRAR